MKNLLIVLIACGFWCFTLANHSRAQTYFPAVYTGEPAPAGSIFTENFGENGVVDCYSISGTGCDHPWVNGNGTPATIASSSACAANPPAGSGTYGLHFVNGGAVNNFIYHSGWFSTVPASTDFDAQFHFCLAAAPGATGVRNIFAPVFSSTSSGPSNKYGDIRLNYAASVITVYGTDGSATNSTAFTITTATNYVLRLVEASGAGNSTFSIDGSTCPGTSTATCSSFTNSRMSTSSLNALIFGPGSGSQGTLDFTAGYLRVTASGMGVVSSPYCCVPPNLFWDAENSTDGTTMTTTIANAALHFGAVASAVPWTCTGLATMKISTTYNLALPNSLLVMNTSYDGSTGSTRSLKYDASLGNSANCEYSYPPAVGLKVSQFGLLHTPVAGVNRQFNPFRIGCNAGCHNPVNYVALLMNHTDGATCISGGVITGCAFSLETTSTNGGYVSLPINWQYAFDTTYAICIQLDNTPTGSDRLRIWDGSAGWAKVVDISVLDMGNTGGGISAPFTDIPNSFNIGSAHGQTSLVGATPFYEDSVAVDYINGTYCGGLT